MPLIRLGSRRRLGLAAIFLTAGFAVGAWMGSRDTKSAERARYERIEEGMDRARVREVLRDWAPRASFGTGPWSWDSWRAPNGATVNVTYGADDRVAFKGFEEGDLSLVGKVRRLVGRAGSP